MIRGSVVFAIAFALAPTVSGCGLLLDLDPQRADGGAGLDGGRPVRDGQVRDRDGSVAARDGEAPPLGPCEGLPVGDPCSAPEDRYPAICLGGVCVRSSCGDGYIDGARDEECDDGNTVAGDGCEPDCTFSCHEDTECSDGLPCDGEEQCTGGVCIAGPPASDGDPCSVDGVCEGGRCSTCGDGSVDVGEECDDGNTVDGDGCEGDCRYACSPARTCAVVPCMIATCTMHECGYADADRDGDGYITGESNAGMMCSGPDCNDMDPNIHPGAPDRCNLVDDDCDTNVDEDVPSVTCWPDNDRDGFGGDMRVPIPVCGSCPAGYAPQAGDCDDLDANVHPGQTAWFDRPSIGARSYDYNCDGDETLEYPLARPAGTMCIPPCEPYWLGSAPACGATAAIFPCSLATGGACRLDAVMTVMTARCH